jgi:hypothetical protein
MREASERATHRSPMQNVGFAASAAASPFHVA